ncbi:hypothetical protein [Shewanella maritima]|uniref:hypothetical protein n=1 Tax=Shewanella maritima TaxID=2520507 RepID=UPI0037362C47
MRLVLSLLIMFIPFISFLVNAETKSIVCNGCSSEEMQIQAERSSNRYKQSHVVVLDFVDETARKYSLVPSDGRFGKPIMTSNESYITSGEQHDIDLIFSYRKELIRVIKLAEAKSQISFPVFSPQQHSTTSSNSTELLYAGEVKAKGSPYDFMTASYYQNGIYDFYFEGPDAQLSHIISDTLDKVNIPDMKEMGAYLRIIFVSNSDGTGPNGFLSVTFDVVTQTFDVIGGRDGDKNTVPLSSSDVLGKDFQFTSGEDKAKFEKYSSTLVGGSTSGSGGCTLQVVASKQVGDRYIYTYTCE